LDNKINFIGIGAHKSGTSWIFERLREIDHFELPPVKEIHYFDRKYKQNKFHFTKRFPSLKSYFESIKICVLNFNRINWFYSWYFKSYSDSWYVSLFKSKKIQGEITPAYSILSVEEIRRLKKVANPEKILFIIRNPIERAWSHYQYLVQRGKKFDKKNLVKEIKSFMLSDEQRKRSNYIEIINKYRNFFQDEDIYILFYDSILNEPEALIENMMSVFGIKKINLMNCNFRDVNNSSKKLRIPIEISKLVNELYKKDISVLSEKIGSYCKIWNGEKIEKAKIWNIKSLKQISYSS
jgi:hypothetical protein